MSLNHFRDSRVKHSCICINGELACREFSSYVNNMLKGIILYYSTEAFVYSSWRSIAFIATEHLCCLVDSLQAFFRVISPLGSELLMSFLSWEPKFPLGSEQSLSFKDFGTVHLVIQMWMESHWKSFMLKNFGLCAKLLLTTSYKFPLWDLFLPKNIVYQNNFKHFHSN